MIKCNFLLLLKCIKNIFFPLRNLCQTPEDDPNRQPLLNILAEMSMHQNRLGYLLLYFLKASKAPENRMSSYKDYVNTQGSWAPVTRHSESKDLATYLLNDLKVCWICFFIRGLSGIYFGRSLFY